MDSSKLERGGSAPFVFLAKAVGGALIASTLLAGSAFAATVHGADSYSTDVLDVLNVEGSAGEKVFLTVKDGRQTIAQNLAYTVGENAQADQGGTWAGVATLDIDGLDLGAFDGRYVIEAYASRAGGEALYSGALYGVYADLPGGTQQLIGTRTVNEAESSSRAFDAPETVFENGHTYRLASENATNTGGVLHYPYVEYDEAKTVDGVVRYVDANGTVVASTKIPGLAYDEKRTVDIPAVVTAADGTLYRTVFFKNSVVAENPGRTSFSVYCTKMSEAEQSLAGFYVATIQMVDEAGAVIATDSVNVTGEFLYTAPSVIYKNVTDAASGESGVVAYQLEGSPTVRLSAANDGVVNRARTITVHYKAQPREASEATVTFNYLDGSLRVNDKNRSLGTGQAVANNATPTVEPPSTIEANGTTYHIAGAPADYAYALHSGAAPSVDVFYLPEGYTAPGAYNVTVNYVNFLTGATIESHSYTSDPDANSRITIDSPESFEAGGVNYVRLDGQDAVIAHSYFSGIAEYTVYYRDVNDTLSSGTVINTIRVVYLDGTTQGAPGTAADAGAAAAAAGADAGAQALQLNGGRTYNVFDGDGNATLTNEGGVDSNTERIEDSETPLASGFDRGGTSSAAASLMQPPAWAVPVGVGAAVVVVALIALVVFRRRTRDDLNDW